MSVQERKPSKVSALLHPRAAVRELHDAARPRMLWHQEIITCLLATWLVQGLTMDAWAHTNESTLDTVLTPWHGLFYGGFAMLAGWVAWQISHHHDEGHRGLAAVPVGYGVALVGIGIFFMAGVGDQIWHAIFGIERDLEAFLSPTHLMLVIGMCLLISTPFRNMWTDKRPQDTSFIGLLPAIWSIALTTLLISLISEYLVVFPSDLTTISQDAFVSGFPGAAPGPLLEVYHARFEVQGVIMVLMTNILLFAPVLLGLRRWQLPFGSITFIWTFVIASDLVSYQYNNGWTLVAVVIGGLIADWLVLRFRASGGNVNGFRIFAALAPVGLWTCYFIVLAVAYNIGWSAELAAGVTVIASMMTLILAYMMVPSPVPAAAAAAGPVDQTRS